MKTVKAAKKRFKVGARGKVKYQPAGKQHLNSSMSSKRKRHKRGMKPVSAEHDALDIKRCLLQEGK